MKEIYITEEDKFLKKDKMVFGKNNKDTEKLKIKKKPEEDKLLNKIIISLKNEDYNKLSELSELSGLFPISIFARSIIINYLRKN